MTGPLAAAAAPAPAVSVAMFAVQIAVLLLLALALGRLATRLSVPGVVGELAAGVMLGPSLLGTVAPGLRDTLFPGGGQPLMLEGVGQITVLLIVGLAGLHVDRTILREHAGRITTIVVPAFLLPLAGGYALGMLVPASLLPAGVDRTTLAMFLGVALSLSAMPVAAYVFQQLGVTRTYAARLSLASAVVVDAVAWVLLSLVTGRATGADPAERTLHGIAGMAFVVGVIVLLPRIVLLAGRLRPRRGPHEADASPARLPAAGALVLMFAGAGVTATLGLEGLLGAFAVGVALSTCAGLDRSGLDSAQSFVGSVLGPLFFAGIGLKIDIAALRPVDWLLVAVLVAIATATKLIGAGAGAFLAGLERRDAITVAAALNARGAVELIVADLGLRTGILDARWHAAIAVVAIVTSMMAAPLLRWSLRARPDGRVVSLEQEQVRRDEARAA